MTFWQEMTTTLSSLAMMMMMMTATVSIVKATSTECCFEFEWELNLRKKIKQNKISAWRWGEKEKFSNQLGENMRQKHEPNFGIKKHGLTPILCFAFFFFELNWLNLVVSRFIFVSLETEINLMNINFTTKEIAKKNERNKNVANYKLC